MFGQSEVTVTNNRLLMINRKNKMDTMKGNIADG